MTIRARGRTDAGPDRGPSRTDHTTGGRPAAVYLPGVVAGGVGFLVFLVLHALWILPIWFVIPLGTIVAGVGGATVGWAFAYVKPHLPQGVIRRWIAVLTGTILVLTSTTILVWLGDPYVPVVDGVVRTETIDGPLLAVRFVVDLVVVTAITGAVVGWLLTRRRRGALAVSSASVAFALGPGHNLPFFHPTAHPAAARTGLLLVFVVIVSASAVLVVVDRVFEAKDGR